MDAVDLMVMRVRNGIEVYAGNVSPNISERGRQTRWMGAWMRFRVVLRSRIGWEYVGDGMECWGRDVGEGRFISVSVSLEMSVLRPLFQDGAFISVDSVVGIVKDRCDVP